MIPFSIRPSAASDRILMLTLARSLNEWFNDEGLAQMERDLAHHGGFVAVDYDRVIGFVTWRRIDPESADLSWLAVAREHHRTGVGTALLEALEERLHSDGVRRLEVSTVADSLDYEPYARTRAFYRARGFKDFRVDRDFYGDGSERYDRLVMELDLSGGGTG
ncbi:MAG: GNAT family N-acetyltransferase [Thermoplasmata archaeon]